MAYNEEEFLQLSGLQHFRFCRRRWAIIHIENQWAENFRTVDGALMHKNAHDQGFRETRGDRLITRGLPIYSRALGLSGACDVTEFLRDDGGVTLNGREGTWRPYPVEYKRGAPNERSGDHWQLCAQALCLEEMLCCEVTEGALFYGETRRRTVVTFSEELRDEVRAAAFEMHELHRRGYTPRVKPSKSCNACSLKELCLPKLLSRRAVSAYLREGLGERLEGNG